MKLKDIVSAIEIWAPGVYQESYDNSGLLVGNTDWDITGCIVCLDSTEAVIDEAIKNNVNLIIAHHPIVFKGLKRFNGNNYVEKAIIKAIKNDIAIYAVHTNLDNVRSGVNEKICDLLALQNKRILAPKNDLLSKLVFFCPEEDSEKVKNAIYSAGGGKIGNYKDCSFSSSGTGSFTPLEGSTPFKGETNKEEILDENRIEVLVEKAALPRILSALKMAHPYEEVAHEVYKVANSHQQIGSGMVGELKNDTSLTEFLAQVKSTFKAGVIKYTEFTGSVRKVAVCGGSGGFLLSAAKASGADVFITSDYKYHEYFDAENDLSIFDIGHYESEQFTLELIRDYLIDKFPNFAARLTEVNTNPVKYF